jgi:hypothetical protein
MPEPEAAMDEMAGALANRGHVGAREGSDGDVRELVKRQRSRRGKGMCGRPLGHCVRACGESRAAVA